MLRTGFRAVVVLVLTGALLAGCGGGNEAPSLTQRPSAASASVAAGASVQLSVQAADADGDALRYSWMQQAPDTPMGSFSNVDSPSPLWTAPQVAQDTSFRLAVKVTDGAGGEVEDFLDVQVLKPVPANVAPSVTQAASANPTLVEGQAPVQLSVQATDADGDTLGYAWTQQSPATPTGSFSSATARTPTWTPPAVTANTVFTLRVVASDGRGGSTPSEVSVEVRPPAGPTNTAPVLQSADATATTVRAGDTVTLSASATDADGDTLTYTWEQVTPTAQGTFASGKDSAQAAWYSPSLGADTDHTFNVTVRDGKGGEDTETVVVKVTVPRYAADIRPIWSTNSLCTGCHGSSGGLNLTDSVTNSSYARLVDVDTTNASCTTLKRVAPGDPANSSLMRKLEGTTCGNKMPPGSNHFTANPDQLIRIRSWILGGALNN